MPLSTSNSNAEGLSASWHKAWVLGAVLSLLGLVCVEWGYRAHGFIPSQEDDPLLWTLSREQVYQPRSVVLSGASRIQVGFDTDTFRERYPDRPLVPLYIAATWPVAVLRDLSEDERFSGTVIISVKVSSMMRAEFDSQQLYVEAAREKKNVNNRFNRKAKRWLDERVAFRESRITSRKQVLALMRTGAVLPPQWTTMKPDRSIVADYAKAKELYHARVQKEGGATSSGMIPEGGEQLGAFQWVEKLSPEAWLEQALEVEAMADRIAARGGQVIFVRYPTSHNLWPLSERFFPKEHYWDRFAEASDHLCIHFKDYPALDLETAEGSHLDLRSSAG